MSVKSLLLFLFLYVCLVWTGAALLREGAEIRTFGLLWTAVGLIVVIAWIISSWLWGWFRVARARTAVKPKTSTKAAPALSLHEDDAALLALIQEARSSLARSANAAANARFFELPVYLLVGPDGAGKTSTFLNSALEPVSLSGQPSGAGQTIPTRTCNIWLAKNALFIELGGRSFCGDLSRWASLLRILRGGSSLSWWQRLFKEGEPGLNLRGILALGEMTEFMGASSPQGREKLDRLSSQWHDRLGAIVEVFERPLPVYWITTKTDYVPFFADYFAHLRGPELNQIFGCTLPFTPLDEASAELATAQVENKRLTKFTSPLLHRLAERRVLHLAREEDPARRPGVYEFPREMRRIRPALVQFLVDVFRPHPLRKTPFLRGYYFTGTCEEESNFGQISISSRPDDASIMDATGVFRGDATQVFQSVEGNRPARPVARAGLKRRWAFVPELLTGVVLQDSVVPVSAPVEMNQRIDLYRRVACGAVCFICLLLCLCFLRSWSGNSQLLDSVKGGTVAATRNPTVDDLRALDKLHEQALLLSDYDRGGAPWRLRWGLYEGGAIVQAARDLYFRRFREMLLNGLNEALVAKLKSVPAIAGSNDSNYGLVSGLLKTHLMISSGVCKPDPSFVSRILKQILADTNPLRDYDWRQLADRQIDFFSTELPSGNPVRMAEDGAAVEHAREFLRSIQGADRIYAGLLNEAEKHFGTPQTLGTLASNYRSVLNGPGEVGGVFTPDGWNYIKNASRDVKANMPGDTCLVEPRGLVAGYQQDSAVEGDIQRLFIQDYIQNWQKFVSGFSVIRYNGPSDAAGKLGVLADHKSPLLALFALASNNTTFASLPPTAIEKSTTLITGAIDTAKKNLGVARDPAPDARQANKQFDPAAEMTRAFQPVHWVVPPSSDTWVTDKNNAYVDALAALGQSMSDIAHNSNSDPALVQAASQNYEKALNAARQLEGRLSPNSNGLDANVQRLLEEPITQTHGFLPVQTDPAQKANGAAHMLCANIAATLRKFPFQPSTEDAGLDEFSRVFAPGSGTIWKFEADNLADSLVKDGLQWKPKEGAKLQISSGMLNFLNRAQAITDAFFPKGATQPQLVYTLRPKLDSAYQNAVVELDVDGQPFQWKNSIQKQFSWPPPAGGSGGAVGRVITNGVSFPFASRLGTWAMFRLMRDAEPRLLGSKDVEWKYLRGGDGHPEAISVPVRLEFVGMPEGGDVFNPKFFDGLQCGAKAVQQVQ